MCMLVCPLVDLMLQFMETILHSMSILITDPPMGLHTYLQSHSLLFSDVGLGSIESPSVEVRRV